MKPIELKRKFIELRAEGKSYRAIGEELGISKSSCQKWERDLAADIDALKREQLRELYESYHMTKEARIKNLGSTLAQIDTALATADLSEADPARLLDFKLKYTEALKNEYSGTQPALKLGNHIDAKDIVAALADLLNRIRSGDVSAEQASKESTVITNLLKAYETVEIKTKLEELEAIVGGRT